jgi:anti-sigma B factor antagonist
MASAPTRIDIQQADGITVATFKDRRLLDEVTIDLVGNELYALVDDLGCEKVILNFSDVEYMSSSALGKLIKFHKKILSVAGSLRLCGLKPELQKIFKVLALHKVFKIDKSLEKSLKKI